MGAPTTILPLEDTRSDMFTRAARTTSAELVRAHAGLRPDADPLRPTDPLRRADMRDNSAILDELPSRRWLLESQH